MSTPNTIQTSTSSRSSFDSMQDLNIVNDTKNCVNQISSDDEVSPTFQGKLCFLDTQTINSYVEQFGQLFSFDKDEHVLNHLQQTALTGGLRSSCFRSVCWKVRSKQREREICYKTTKGHRFQTYYYLRRYS